MRGILGHPYSVEELTVLVIGEAVAAIYCGRRRSSRLCDVGYLRAQLAAGRDRRIGTIRARQIQKNCTKREAITPISTIRGQFCKTSTGHILLSFKLLSDGGTD